MLTRCCSGPYHIAALLLPPTAYFRAKGRAYFPELM
jgi:hypothetical protein